MTNTKMRKTIVDVGVDAGKASLRFTLHQRVPGSRFPVHSILQRNHANQIGTAGMLVMSGCDDQGIVAVGVGQLFYT